MSIESHPPNSKSLSEPCHLEAIQLLSTLLNMRATGLEFGQM